jgi:hypothetical protein
MKLLSAVVSRNSKMLNGSQLIVGKLYKVTDTPFQNVRKTTDEDGVFIGDLVYVLPKVIHGDNNCLFNLNTNLVYSRGARDIFYEEMPRTELTLEFNS